MSTDERSSAPEIVDREYGPTRLSATVALTAGAVAALTSAPFVGLAIPFGTAGLLFLATGLFVSGSERWVSLGVVNLFLSILIVGGLGVATVPMLLASMVATLIAWDVGQHAVAIGEQFGRTAPTRRGEVVHAASSTIVGVIAAGIAYGIFLFGTSGQPVLAVVLLLFGTTLLVWALRD